VDNALTAGAQSGRYSVESFTYDPVGGKQIPVVLTDGRMRAAPDEIVLAAVTARDLHAVTGSTIRLAGGTTTQLTFRVTGIGFVPTGPHNEYSDGSWLTPGGYDRLFRGSRSAFKFHLGLVTVRPGADVRAVAHRLNAAAAAIPGGRAFTFDAQPAPPQVLALQDMAVLPLALAAFLIVLAVGAVGHALSSAVRHRRHELAVLRALGLTRWQSRLVLVTQASLLAVIGLAFGIPLGLLAGRVLWREAAALAPLAYFPPVAVWALVLIAPAALVAAIVLAAWPGERAARLQPGQLLRTE
jgi:hypothetical protein